jgi:hypothetical protein
MGGFVSLAAVLAAALAVAPAPAARAAEVGFLPEGLSLYVEENLRYEPWSFFDPSPPGGDPDYDFGGSRLRVGLRYERPHLALHAALQYVQLVSVPDDASGTPGGALGAGALYFDHSFERSPEAVQVKYLSAELSDLFGAGLDVAAGRFSVASGLEADSGIAKLEAVKRARIGERLVGEFGWTHFQRSFDGARVRFRHELGQLDAAFFRPTEGGFEDGGTRRIDAIDVVTAAATARPGALLPGVELQAFYLLYGDERDVAARPDNTGLGAKRADVHVHTFGGHLVGAWRLGPGELDVAAWGAAQTGAWYGDDHRAGAGALEVGYQLAELPWKPWLRIGAFRSTGDSDPRDGDHETFFQVLPTARSYSYTASYNLMNSTDYFLELRLQPTAKLSLLADVHLLRLSSRRDLWYSGGGATQDHGRIFGYAGRSSGGGRHLGTAVELAARYQLFDFLRVHAFYGHIFGGDVARASFRDGDDLDHFFLELTVTREWKGRAAP